MVVVSPGHRQGLLCTRHVSHHCQSQGLRDKQWNLWSGAAIEMITFAADADLSRVARGTPGFSGADLANLLNEAALLATRKKLDGVDMATLEEARDKVLWGRERKSAGYSQRDREITAWHESGHALLQLMMKKLQSANLKGIRISTESQEMGIYKSFNYEIFERRNCVLFAFDGNSSIANLVQEARNGKGRAWVFTYPKSAMLKAKAKSLEGYVTNNATVDVVVEKIREFEDNIGTKMFM